MSAENPKTYSAKENRKAKKEIGGKPRRRLNLLQKTRRSRHGIRRWILPYFKQYRSALALALLLGILTFAFASALMFTSGYLISKAAEAPENIAVILFPVAFVRIFGIGKPLLHYIERLTSHDWILRMTSHLRLDLYNILEKDAVFFKQRYKTGDILGLLAEDIGHLQNLYLRSIFPLIVAWVLSIVTVVLLGFFSLWFALFMLLLLIVIVVLVPLVSLLLNGARQARRKVMKNELYEQLTDNVLGVNDWIISQRTHEYAHAYRDSEQALRALDIKLNRSSRRRGILLQALYALVAVALLAWASVHFGGSYAGAANWIAAFVLGFFPLIDVFTPLPDAAIETSKYRDSIDRLDELPENGHSKQKEPLAADRVTHELTDTPFDTDTWKEKLHTPIGITSKELCFNYPGSERTILNGIDFKFEPGEKVAILGQSGVGKSTLAALIRGDLIPTAGTIEINGVSPSALGEQISDYIGVVQQQTYLFNTTLAENLRVGNQAATDEELMRVLDQVGLGALIQRLPEGLETLVDEAGLRFSGGERHRIALARVLLHQVPIVILDEPSVGLDPLTEQALLDTVFKIMHDKTIIMITHHLTGVAKMDKVIFLEGGKLALYGSPAELAQSSPHYQKLQAFDRGLAL